MADGLNVAVVGATGAVGEVLLELMAERKFPIADLTLLSSERSAGRNLKFNGENVVVQNLADASFDGVDLVLSSASGSISKKFAKTHS